MRILYIGTEIIKPQNGGDMIEQRNQRFIKEIAAGDICFLNPSDFQANSISGRIGMEVSITFIKCVIDTIKHDNIKLVYVSQSYYGRITKHIKKRTTAIVVNFFHNAESDFFYAMYKSNPSLRSYLYYLKARHWERCAAKYADFIITLNARDSERLRELYSRKADFILPTSFKDSYKHLEGMRSDIDYLFLGSSFFANNEGVQWFLNNVMPRTNGMLTIAGKNMEKVPFENLNERVTVIGFVEDLNALYARAKCIISPIFSGSGMKTKTAEALMYGKTIIGTKEAFEGYIINKECMIECNTSDEFVQALSKLEEIPSFNESARTHFLENYSDEFVLSQFKSFINKI